MLYSDTLSRSNGSMPRSFFIVKPKKIQSLSVGRCLWCVCNLYFVVVFYFAPSMTHIFILNFFFHFFFFVSTCLLTMWLGRSIVVGQYKLQTGRPTQWWIHSIVRGQRIGQNGIPMVQKWLLCESNQSDQVSLILVFSTFLLLLWNCSFMQSCNSAFLFQHLLDLEQSIYWPLAIEDKWKHSVLCAHSNQFSIMFWYFASAVGGIILAKLILCLIFARIIHFF